MLSMLAENIIGITDIAFIGRYADLAAAKHEAAQGMIGAAGVGSIYYFVLFMVGFGFATGVQILISRRNGEQNYAKIGGIFETGLMFLWIIAALLIVLSLIFTPAILPSLMQSPEVAGIAATFLSIRVFGLIFSFASVSFRALQVGITDTKPLTFASIITASCNIFLNWALIFGNLGMPEMGIEGAAIASVAAEFFGVAFLFAYNGRKAIRKKYNLFAFSRVNAKTLKNILRISIYVMFQYTASVGTWLMFFLFIEKAGEEHLDSSQLVRSLCSLVTITGWAYAVCTNTLVSNSIGEGRSNLVTAIIRRMVIVSACTAVIFLVPLLLFPSQMLSIFTEDKQLINLSIDSLKIVAGAIVCFSISVIAFNGISGTGKTRTAMIMELISLVVYLGALYLLYMNYLHKPALFWYSEYIYWGMIAILSYAYLYSGRWKKGIEEL
jgi:putative MATE family efflux protein